MTIYRCDTFVVSDIACCPEVNGIAELALIFFELCLHVRIIDKSSQ